MLRNISILRNNLFIVFIFSLETSCCFITMFNEHIQIVGQPQKLIVFRSTFATGQQYGM